MSCCRTDRGATMIGSMQTLRRLAPVLAGATLAAAALVACGGSSDDDSASALLVARFAGVDGFNGASYPDARAKLVAAGVTPRSAKCVHRMPQAGEVLGDNWAGEPPVWVVVEVGAKQRDTVLGQGLGFETYDPKATTLWAPFQGTPSSCPATAG